MRTIKLTLLVVTLITTTMSFVSCNKCKNEDPRARIINNGDYKASVQIKTTEGNTVNINNVDPGTSSSYASYTAGLVTFTISVNSIDYVAEVQMDNCFDYDISIDRNNVITTKAIDRN